MAALMRARQSRAAGPQGFYSIDMSVTLTGEPLLRSMAQGDRLQLAAAGSWTAQHASDLEAMIDDAVAQSKSVDRVDLDMAGVENLDTFGAWLLERLLRGFAEGGRGITVVGLPERFRGLIKEAHRSNRRPAKPAGEDM